MIDVSTARLPSSQDRSINLVLAHADGGFFEHRLVQRDDAKVLVYLSSHTGCAYSCRMCHLTATGQTMMTEASAEGYADQARAVLVEYAQRVAQGQPAAQTVHFNFMARGEPLANRALVDRPNTVYEPLAQQAAALGLAPRFLVSSILPRDFTGDLSTVFSDPRAALYYSLYSLQPAFRKRWLPKAMDPARALDLMADCQVKTNGTMALHWAFIEGENDQDEAIDEVVEAVRSRGLRVKFNLVRYNPHDRRHGQEPSEARLQAIFARLSQGLGHADSRIVPRVGFDVKASCGMFVAPSDGWVAP